MSEVIPLDTLAENECARIVELVGPDSQTHRLQELGLRQGASVRLVRRGEPCILAVDGQRISFRPDPDLMVLVQLDAPAANGRKTR